MYDRGVSPAGRACLSIRAADCLCKSQSGGRPNPGARQEARSAGVPDTLHGAFPRLRHGGVSDGAEVPSTHEIHPRDTTDGREAEQPR